MNDLKGINRIICVYVRFINMNNLRCYIVILRMVKNKKVQYIYISSSLRIPKQKELKTIYRFVSPVYMMG